MIVGNHPSEWSCFNISRRGFSHQEAGCECQDASTSFLDGKKGYIAVADGHGSPRYFRSSLGSKIAIEAFQSVCRSLNRHHGKLTLQEGPIKRAFLSEWDHLVERHFIHHPFTPSELTRLSEHDRERVKESFYTAYGTNFHGFAFGEGYCFALTIGDGGFVTIDTIGRIFDPFDWFSEENAGNLTQSLCDEESRLHLHYKAFNLKEITVMAVATDGTMVPFQNFTNYATAMVAPFQKVTLKEDAPLRGQCRDFISQLAQKSGSGDDCSFALLHRFVPSDPCRLIDHPSCQLPA
jgi:hypothetical protein